MGVSTGITVDSFSLKDIVLYKDANFKFTPGVTFVQAVNLNRPGRNSNYSGKSLLFTSLVNAMINTEPLITKNARTLQKDIFSSKKSQVSIQLSKAKRSFNIIKSRTATRIEKDGRDQKLRTAALATEYVQKLIPVNEEEFFTLYYIDSRRPSNFQFGTSASRFEFFTNLFRLEDLDEARKWLRQELSSLKENQITADRIKQELKEIGKEKDAGSLQQKVEKLQTLQKELTSKSRHLQKNLHLLDMYRMYRPLKKEYDDLLERLHSGASRKEIKQIDSRLEEIEKGRERNARIQERSAQRKKLQGELAQLKLKDKLKQLKPKQLHRIIDKVRKIERQYGDQEKPSKVEPPNLKKIESLAKELGVKLTKDWDQNHEHLLELRTQIKAELSVSKTSLREFTGNFSMERDSHSCPTCLRNLKGSAARTIQKTLSRRLRIIGRKMDRCGKILVEVKSCIQFASYVEQRKLYEKSREKMAKLESYNLDQLERLLRIQERLEELPVKIEELFGDSKEEERKLRKRKELISKALSIQKQLEDFKDVEELKSASKMNEHRLKKDQQRLDEKLEQVQRKLPKLQSELDRISEHNSRRKKLRSEYKQLEENLSDIPLYEAMIEAYSTSGMKMLLIKKIAGMVESNMNAAAKILYQEPYSFKLNVENNRFDCIVHRTLAGKVMSSDIRRMSGAESRIFSLLLALSLLPFIPKERRLNFMILDEPGENLDQGMEQIFRELLIPRLSQIIPSIVVITPKDNLLIPGARVLTVVKKGAQSRLIEGKYEAANEPKFKKKA